MLWLRSLICSYRLTLPRSGCQLGALVIACWSAYISRSRFFCAKKAALTTLGYVPFSMYLIIPTDDLQAREQALSSKPFAVFAHLKALR